MTGGKYTFKTLDNLPFSQVSDAEILDFLLDKGDLAVLPFDDCNRLALFDFFNPCSSYYNTFVSLIVHKPILTVQDIYISKYSVT